MILVNSKASVALQNSLKVTTQFTAVQTIALLNVQLNWVESQLDQLINQAPKLFNFAPIVIDFSAIELELTQEQFEDIVALFRNKQLIVIACVSQAIHIHQWAQQQGFAGQQNFVKKNKKTEVMTTKVVKGPIRSGQQVYAQNQHLVVLTSVGAGAEVLADGDIHIYGALRGKAMAGVNSATGHQIICAQMQGELVSVQGHYMIADQLPNFEHAVHFFISDGELQFKPLDNIS